LRDRSDLVNSIDGNIGVTRLSTSTLPKNVTLASFEEVHTYTFKPIVP
jgi:hypothetical protein